MCRPVIYGNGIAIMLPLWQHGTTLEKKHAQLVRPNSDGPPGPETKRTTRAGSALLSAEHEHKKSMKLGQAEQVEVGQLKVGRPTACESCSAGRRQETTKHRTNAKGQVTRQR